jgi:hypothetical protein
LTIFRASTSPVGRVDDGPSMAPVLPNLAPSGNETYGAGADLLDSTP